MGYLKLISKADQKFNLEALRNNDLQTVLNIFQNGTVKFPALKSISVLLSILLFTGSFLLYANTLRNGYAIDDVAMITHNKFVTKGIKGIPEILTTTHMSGFAIYPNETYRPLSLVFFAAEYELWGPSPAAGHFFNVLFFGLCVVLLFLFLDNLFARKRTLVAFIAALLFAVHPIHTEVVDNIKSFDELLCFFFAFLSLNIFTRYMERGHVILLLWGVSALFLSLISKETAISFVIMVPVTFFFYKNENKRRALYISVGTILAAISFIGLRALILKMCGNTTLDVNMLQNELAGAPNVYSRFATTILILGYYIKLLLIPHPLISDYSIGSIPYAHFTDAGVWITIILYTVLIVTAVYRLFKFRKDTWAFAILFFLITITLFSNTFFLIPSMMSERFTFFASVGFCLFMSLAFEKWIIESKVSNVITLSKSKVWIVLSPVLLIFCFLTTSRNNEWFDSYTLQKNDLKKAPNNYHLNYCLGRYLIDSLYKAEENQEIKQKMLDTGICYLEKSLTVDSLNIEAHIHLAYAFYLNHQYDSAQTHNKIALRLNPNDLSILTNSCCIEYLKKNYDATLALSLKIISIDTTNELSYASTALSYYNLKKPDSCIIYLRKAINLNPRDKQLYGNLALAFKELNKTDSANKYAAILTTMEMDSVVDL